MKKRQTTSTILMVRPIHFDRNAQTAVNNHYQQKDAISSKTLQKDALDEFDNFVVVLEANDIEVLVLEDTPDPVTPDAIFPNNWISFHQSGDIVLYPMFAKNRRQERRLEAVVAFLENKGFVIENITDYTGAEKDDIFLEGTGSMVLDRENGKAYTAISPRTNEDLLIEFCEDFDYTPVVFEAIQQIGDTAIQIYHTNVMMAVGKSFAVVCLESITDKKQRKNLLTHLKQDVKEIIDITSEQLYGFAGNVLQVTNKYGKECLVMSQKAFKTFTPLQIEQIEKYTHIISSPLTHIEKNGGGSARCMMAEVFLPKK